MGFIFVFLQISIVSTPFVEKDFFFFLDVFGLFNKLIQTQIISYIPLAFMQENIFIDSCVYIMCMIHITHIYIPCMQINIYLSNKISICSLILLNHFSVRPQSLCECFSTQYYLRHEEYHIFRISLESIPFLSLEFFSSDLTPILQVLILVLSRSLGWEKPLEKKIPSHSSILAWQIPWTEEPGGLQLAWSQRVRHN